MFLWLITRWYFQAKKTCLTFQKNVTPLFNLLKASFHVTAHNKSTFQAIIGTDPYSLLWNCMIPAIADVNNVSGNSSSRFSLQHLQSSHHRELTHAHYFGSAWFQQLQMWIMFQAIAALDLAYNICNAT